MDFLLVNEFSLNQNYQNFLGRISKLSNTVFVEKFLEHKSLKAFEFIERKYWPSLFEKYAKKNENQLRRLIVFLVSKEGISDNLLLAKMDEFVQKIREVDCCRELIDSNLADAKENKGMIFEELPANDTNEQP